MKEHLLLRDGSTAFTILDGASVPGLPQRLATYADRNICLFRGNLEPDLAEVAPYLLLLADNSPFTDWVLADGWGQHWGIFGVARGDLLTLRNHFRRLLIVYDENGKSLNFRYYDPRVLRAYLPACTDDQLRAIFGPVLFYLVEDEEPGYAARLAHVDNKVIRHKIPLRY